MLFLIVAVIFVITLYAYSTRNFDYWKKRGVVYENPIPLFGNHANVFLLKEHITQVITRIYHKYSNEKVVGLFRANSPELIIRDPEIIKRILITDFSHFHLRQIVPLEGSTEPLLHHLVNVNGDTWRLLRHRLTPAFTSGKLKAMFPLIVQRAERLHTRIQATTGTTIDARDLMARFTTDIIGAVGFGIEMDAINDDDSEFRKLGKKIFNMSVMDSMKMFLKQMSPKTFKNVRFTGHFEGDMMPMVKSVLKQRDYKPSGRHDFVDLLLECKQKGLMVGPSIENFKSDGTPETATLEMTDELIAAQMFVFFAAGFETSSSTSSMTLHQLAYHPDKQIKVQQEIDRVLSKHDNKLCYEAISEMHYLEWAFKESMRMYPAVGFLIRDCVHKYTFTDINLTIDKGVRIIIPAIGLQNDPEYFENPTQYKPERFSPEELDARKTKFAYLPFGDGPRACIGERLGQMQALAGLAAVLSRFSVEPAPTSVKIPIYDSKPSIVQIVKGGIPLIFRERKKVQ